MSFNVRTTDLIGKEEFEWALQPPPVLDKDNTDYNDNTDHNDNTDLVSVRRWLA